MSDDSSIKISVTGARNETSFTKDMIAAEIKRNVKRWEKFSGIRYLNINIERHESGGTAEISSQRAPRQSLGSRVKYSVKVEATGDGSYHADAHDWSLEKAMHEALDRLGEELLKKKEKTYKGRFRRLLSRSA